MAGRDPDDPFELDSSDLERLMAALRPGSPAAAMRPRLREFQKRSFPKFANAGRGKRATYTMRETLHVALAFELVDMDLSSPRCINIVESNKRTLDPLFVGAWATLRQVNAGEADKSLVSERRHRLAMHVALSAATHDAGAYVAFGGPPDDPWPSHWPGRRSRMSIDLIALVTDVVTALEGEAMRFLPREVDAEFKALGAATFRSSKVADWQPAPLPAKDGRITR